MSLKTFKASIPSAMAVALASLATVTAVAHAAAHPPVPASVAAAAEYGETVYDDARASDWSGAGRELQSLKQAARRMHAEVVPGTGAEARIDAAMAPLTQAIVTRDRAEAMRLANQVTRNVADLTAIYAPAMPPAVALLDYYGRELWSQAQNSSRLHETASAMRREWDALRPEVAAHGRAEAARFEALVARVEQAQAPADFARLATPILDEVDRLEKVFENGRA